MVSDKPNTNANPEADVDLIHSRDLWEPKRQTSAGNG
jgi:hypothetical protein